MTRLYPRKVWEQRLRAISAPMTTTGSLSCRGKMAIHKPFDSRVARNQSVWQRRLFTQRSSFRHRGTAIAVARIFPTASRKFPSFSISGCLPSEKLSQPDRMTRAMGGPHRVHPQLPRVWFCIHNQQLVFILSGNLPSAKSTNLWHL
jgi:hypothetical protein